MSIEQDKVELHKRFCELSKTKRVPRKLKKKNKKARDKWMKSCLDYAFDRFNSPVRMKFNFDIFN